MPHRPTHSTKSSAPLYQGWTDLLVEERVIRELYDLLKWGPTSANCSPARFVWVRSMEGKAKLAELVFEKNRPNILRAPLTVIIGNDLDFADRLPTLLPHNAEAIQKGSVAICWPRTCGGRRSSERFRQAVSSSSRSLTNRTASEITQTPSPKARSTNCPLDCGVTAPGQVS